MILLSRQSQADSKVCYPILSGTTSHRTQHPSTASTHRPLLPQPSLPQARGCLFDFGKHPRHRHRRHGLLLGLLQASAAHRDRKSREARPRRPTLSMGSRRRSPSAVPRSRLRSGIRELRCRTHSGPGKPCRIRQRNRTSELGLLRANATPLVPNRAASLHAVHPLLAEKLAAAAPAKLHGMGDPSAPDTPRLRRLPTRHRLTYHA